MIDFKNAEYLKLKQVRADSVHEDVKDILVDGEKLVSAYKSIRDFIVFTDKRVIAVNSQGMTGKKKDMTSLPYSKIIAYSIETSGVLDLDSELEMYFSGLGKVRFEFLGSSNIAEIGRLISSYVL